MGRDKTEKLLYLSARVGVLSAALPSWEEIAHRAGTEETGPEGQGILPLREDAQTGALLASLAQGAGRPIVDLFRFPFDCHNAKVLLKGAVTGQAAAAQELLSPCGSVPEETMREAMREEGGAAALPSWLRRGAAEARRAWTESRSAQLLDAALDRALYREMGESALHSGSAAAQEYVRVRIDGVNLQTVLRMQKSTPEAVEEMLLEGGNVGVSRLLEARDSGNLAAVFFVPSLRSAAEKGSAERAGEAAAEALAAFARRCSVYAFGAEALLAFLLRLELRRRGLRISTALGNSLSAEEVKKRLEVYDG
ncbi:V-type ATPase subunit [bacterium 210917-SL.2.15]|nr:V-type ATPase subunit [bacterium 210917-SL.2.15]